MNDTNGKKRNFRQSLINFVNVSLLQPKLEKETQPLRSGFLLDELVQVVTVVTTTVVKSSCALCASLFNSFF